MPRKPLNLIYGTEERPPWNRLLILAAEHATFPLVSMVYPVLAARHLGLGTDETFSLVTICLLVCGIGTFIQCMSRRFGSSLLAVHQPTPVFLPAYMGVAGAGGLGAASFLMMPAGLLQIAASRFVWKLRKVFPPEVCGISIMMLGLSLVEPGLQRALGLFQGQPTPDRASILAAMVTLFTIVGVSIWSGPKFKIAALLIGCAVGYGLSYVLGIQSESEVASIAGAPLASFPHLTMPSWHVSWGFLPVFLITGVISSIDSLGVLIAVQKMNDADWRKPDLRGAGRGILADGIGNLLSGLAGAYPSGISSANAGMAFVTGATSRIIGGAAACLLVATAFLPKVGMTITCMPMPVVGALFLYAAAYLLVSGMDLILSRILSERRIFVVGLSIIAGMSVSTIPHLYDWVPGWLQPLFSSQLTVGALSAIILNQVFRLGISQRNGFRLSRGMEGSDDIRKFFERQGELWGMRRDVMENAIWAVRETADILKAGYLAEKGEMDVTAAFDEFNLNVDVAYTGKPIEMPDMLPSLDDLVDEEKSRSMLSAYIIRRHADGVAVRRSGESVIISLHFEH